MEDESSIQNLTLNLPSANSTEMERLTLLPVNEILLSNFWPSLVFFNYSLVAIQPMQFIPSGQWKDTDSQLKQLLGLLLLSF